MTRGADHPEIVGKIGPARRRLLRVKISITPEVRTWIARQLADRVLRQIEEEQRGKKRAV